MCNEDSGIQCPLCTMLRAFEKHPMGQHLRAAQREFLLAMRSVLDARIDALKDEAAKGPQKVHVE